jgi:heterodisulfide reductase subunit A
LLQVIIVATQKTRVKTSQPETELTPDTGVILSDCNGTLQEYLDFNLLEQELCKFGTVAAVTHCPDLRDSRQCSEAIHYLVESGARRITVGGPGREQYEEQFRKILKKEKVNYGYWWPVNIREECGLACSGKDAATSKALSRLATAVKRVALSQPVSVTRKPVRQNVIVVGAGIAGLQTAVSLSKLGMEVSLVHSQVILGGTVIEMPELYSYVCNSQGESEEAVMHTVNQLAKTVRASDAITVYPRTSLKSVEGELGDFTVTVLHGSREEVLKAGAIVLATGSGTEPAMDHREMYQSTRVVDVSRLLSMIRKGSSFKRVAIIMDIVAEQDRAVTAQVLSAAELLANRYASHVKIYCRNVRVASTGLERLYRRTREAGVIVLKVNDTPDIQAGSTSVAITVYDPVAEQKVTDEFDLAVIADLQPGNNGNAMSAPVGGLRRGPDGAIQFDDVWLLPSQTNRPGIFVAGAARGNSEFREALTDGMAVAMEIHGLLSEGTIEVTDDVATVDADKCVLCLTCLRLCPHGAIRIGYENNAADVSPVSCQRCGICVSECPAEAITLPGYTDEQMAAEIGDKPRVTVFACENSAIPAADAAAAAGCTYSTDIEIIRVPCTGKVDPRSVLSALENGAESVLVLGCHPESCKYLSGSSRAAERIERIAALLEKVGVDGSRVRFGGIASVEPAAFIRYVQEATR